MYGSRVREQERVAIVTEERKSENALNHVKRCFSEMQTQKAMVPQLESELRILKNRITQCKGRTAIREYFKLKLDIKELEQKICNIKSGQEAQLFYERAAPLIVQTKSTDPNIDQQREALAMVLFHKEKSMPVFIQTDLCTLCKEELKFKAEESLMVCPKCCNTMRYLNMATDHVDVDYFAQDTHANHSKSTASGGIEETDSMYPKPQMYEAFLTQFRDDVPDPPPKVFDIILTELSKVHVASASKVQSTSVRTILKQKDLKQYLMMAYRIALTIEKKDGTAIPKFSEALIKRLMVRLHMFLDTVKNTFIQKRKLSPNLKELQTLFKFITINFLIFLTRIFLIMEGEIAMSELFNCHKTRSVHRREDARIRKACEQLTQDKSLEGFNWEYIRSL